VCEAGRCRTTRCVADSADCDGNPWNGCETFTRNSLVHCGACGRACGGDHATPACEAGVCTLARCADGYDDCDGDFSNGCEHAGACVGVTFRPTAGACTTQSFVAPAAGVYRISAAGGGAAGGGAQARGDFELRAGEALAIVVGRSGDRGGSMEATGRGAGGTFVVRGTMPLIIAGGGGGPGSSGRDDFAGASVGEEGSPGGYSRTIAGHEMSRGALGGTAGGDGISLDARGGMGFNARTFVVGGACEDRGGVGGRYALAEDRVGGGGGGGGYSGGGAGPDATGRIIGIGTAASGNGGGGGSFNRGARPWNLPNFNRGDGVVTIWRR
jgi:hypothetical protein